MSRRKKPRLSGATNALYRSFQLAPNFQLRALSLEMRLPGGRPSWENGEAELGKNGTTLLDPTSVRLWLVPRPLGQLPSK